MLISFPLPLRVLAALTTAFVCALASTPSVVSLAERVHAVDLPGEERKIHKRAVPRLGGIGILAAFFAALLCFTRPDAPFSGVLRGALLIALMGAADDCSSAAPSIMRSSFLASREAAICASSVAFGLLRSSLASCSKSFKRSHPCL